MQILIYIGLWSLVICFGLLVTSGAIETFRKGVGKIEYKLQKFSFFMFIFGLGMVFVGLLGCIVECASQSCGT